MFNSCIALLIIIIISTPGKVLQKNLEVVIPKEVEVSLNGRVFGGYLLLLHRLNLLEGGLKSAVVKSSKAIPMVRSV